MLLGCAEIYVNDKMYAKRCSAHKANVKFT